MDVKNTMNKFNMVNSEFGLALRVETRGKGKGLITLYRTFDRPICDAVFAHDGEFVIPDYIESITDFTVTTYCSRIVLGKNFDFMGRHGIICESNEDIELIVNSERNVYFSEPAIIHHRSDIKSIKAREEIIASNTIFSAKQLTSDMNIRDIEYSGGNARNNNLTANLLVSCVIYSKKKNENGVVTYGLQEENGVWIQIKNGVIVGTEIIRRNAKYRAYAVVYKSMFYIGKIINSVEEVEELANIEAEKLNIGSDKMDIKSIKVSKASPVEIRIRRKKLEEVINAGGQIWT